MENVTACMGNQIPPRLVFLALAFNGCNVFEQYKVLAAASESVECSNKRTCIMDILNELFSGMPINGFAGFCLYVRNILVENRLCIISCA